MFAISSGFGWSKASKCKKMIKRARSRLEQLKNKREVTANQLRKDLSELIQNSHEETAIERAEQLIQDENLVAAYELLDQFLEFILKKHSYIKKHKDYPPDINEAVSSLIFASARIGDFPELCVLRKLFAKRFGEDFATAAIHQLPGNFVNQKLIENLTVKFLPDDLKFKVIDEIARDNCLQPKVNEHQRNQIVEVDSQINYNNAEFKNNPSKVVEIERGVTCVSSSITKPSDYFSLSKSDKTEAPPLVSTVHQYPLYLTYHSLQKEEKKEDFLDMQNKEELMSLVSLANAEAEVEYVEDIDEYDFIVLKDGYCKDQRLFQSQGRKRRNAFDIDLCDCNLDQPCYCCVYNDEGWLGEFSIETRIGIRGTQNQSNVWLALGEFCYCHPLSQDESNKGMESPTIPQPRHVHPKLPDYEDIVTIFTALKRERQRMTKGQ
ncbi:hypothetical protein RJT34_31235 [Clitoria ternatea]|uniref:Uncharacterized protein n=1 Tax=Clitoria ternatea TaxID=43366 RepID=A0AAN9EW32_CLITE